MNTKALRNQDRIPELQLVRALAILCVLTVHASASATIAMQNSGYYWIYNFINVFMRVGTPTFIFLSSFVLFYSYYRRPLDRKLISSFYKKRLLYILVPYAVFSAIYFVVVRYGANQALFDAEALATFWKKLLTGKAYAHLYFIFISIQFYALFPVLLWATKRWTRLVHFLIPLGLVVQWGFVLLNKHYWHVTNKGSWSLSYFSFFFLGAALGIYYPKIKNWIVVSKANASLTRVSAWALLWTAWLTVALVHVTVYYQARANGVRFNSTLYEFLWNFHSLTSALAIVQAAFYIYRRFPNSLSKLLQPLGRYSFGIYLIHLLFLYTYDRFMPDYGISWMSHFKYLGSWAVMLSASLAVVAFLAKFLPGAWMLFGRLPDHAGSRRNVSIRKFATAGTAAVLAVAIVAIGIWVKKEEEIRNPNVQQAEVSLNTTDKLTESYDVVVVGTDPEGVAAAVSAARNGLSVLLVEGRNRTMLGGLMTHGGLNSIDLIYAPGSSTSRNNPVFLNKGIFQEFYEQIEGSSFDLTTAANAFARMVNDEPNIDLVMNARDLKPLSEKDDNGQIKVTGVSFKTDKGAERNISSSAVIDATQDADIAAAAGAPFTFGREDLGEPDAKMAVTLVFKMSGVTPSVWNSFSRHPNTGVDAMSAWGFSEAKNYVSDTPERVRMRGLNIGRQNDDTMLINAMHIFNVDPLDPSSVEKALATGKAEAPKIVDYLTKNTKEFKNLKFAGTADELYVRETRHLLGEYRLTLADVMDNRDHWDAIAYGSYDLDVQSTDHTNAGYILMSPYQYGIPFRTLVPLQVDNLLVVGRSASYDSLPHSSARVIPVGMATGQAASVAVKLAKEHGITVRELSRSKDLIARLRSDLTGQGVDLTVHEFKKPAYSEHKAYRGLLAAASLLMTSGSSNNKEFKLDDPSNAQRYAYQLTRLNKAHPKAFPGKAVEAMKGLDKPGEIPLSLEQAVRTISLAISDDPNEAVDLDQMLQRGWIKPNTLDAIEKRESLTNGEAFLLMRDVLEYYAGIVYE
ncbi:FAD-dependent oxidoreductase [Cohnella phaseoli]|uniref:Peptidoglycan/LPS O-acetylase OafA/YrhL n=1 Tax=Cohnella phaseoli TaxID=456490 RepID=A0A3D9JW10_9BACL|nr:peptidoglycan/LPS O-acetylase OafA/YrhL [Cohnella phaseoli]